MSLFDLPPNVLAARQRSGTRSSTPDGAAPSDPVEVSFASMGTWCHLIVHGGTADAATRAQRHVESLDRAWTRFDASSELCQFNASAGAWQHISDDLRVLIGHALLGWRLTGGAFDPFLVDDIARVGYDRDFDGVPEAAGEQPAPAARRRAAAPGEPPVILDPARNRALLTPGWGLDSGGVGKGLAADLVATAALLAGARSVLVNLGGDLRCAGVTPTGGWKVSLDDAWEPGRPSGWSVKLTGGAVATSSPLRRSWTYADGSVGHHLLDPRTGTPLESRYAAVSVIARRAWVAEVLTKAVLLLPERRSARLLRSRDAAAIVTDIDGGTRRRLG